ncbi:MBL fold metallo-hydrolase [Thermodesulfobacteriota bacterium]
MSVDIYPIQVGFDGCYLIKDKGVIMIDGGYPKKLNHFQKGIQNIPIEANEIQLMVITHGHWDHIGSAKDIQATTGAKIAMHSKEQNRLEKGLKIMPPGVTLWGRIFSKINSVFLPLIHIPETGVDVVIDDDGLSLTEYGIAGKVFYTPGHSPGSVSVLLDTGDAFVGDMAMNKFPLCFGPSLPIFAEESPKLIQSWQLLLDQGARTIYPAHGKPFSADIMRKALT